MLDNLAQLHLAICAGLRGKLGSALTIDVYPANLASITPPAVYLDLNKIEPGTDPRTGETALVGHFLARIVIDPMQANSELQLRELAAAIAVAINNENWGLEIGSARFMQSGADHSKPEWSSYLVWAVEWTHEFHLGAQVDWQTYGNLLAGGIADYPENMAPAGSSQFAKASTLMLGLYPDTGANKETEYWPAGSEPGV